MGISSFQILTPVSPLIREWSWVPFSLLQLCRSPPLPAWGPRLSSLYLWTSLCCNYVQRTWWVQGGGVRSVFCPLVLLPQCSCTHLFKGTCTGTGHVPPLPTRHPPCSSFLFTHLPVYSQASALSPPGSPPFTLFPLQPPSGEGGLPLSSRGWNPMFTFSSVSAPTLCGALRNQKRTCCCT